MDPVDVNEEINKVQLELSSINNELEGKIDVSRNLNESKDSINPQVSLVSETQLHRIGENLAPYYDMLRDDPDIELPSFKIYESFNPVIPNLDRRNRKKYNRHVSIQKFAVLNAKGWMFEDLFKYFSYLYAKKEYANDPNSRVQIIFSKEYEGLINKKNLGQSFFRTKLLHPNQINYNFIHKKLIEDFSNKYNAPDLGSGELVSFIVRKVKIPVGRGKENQRNSKIKITPPWNEYCGQACLARFIYRSKLKNLKDDKWSLTRQDKWLAETKKLAIEIEHNKPSMQLDDFNKFVIKYPNIRVVIFDEDRNIIFKSKMGESSCFIALNNGHYELINLLLGYLKYDKTNKSYKTCDYCLKLYIKDHKCIDKEYCNYCNYNFKNFEDGQAHLNDINLNSLNAKKLYCKFCNKKLPYANCLKIHESTCEKNSWWCEKCNCKHLPSKVFGENPVKHKCGEYLCKVCDIVVYPDQYHRCFLQVLKKAKGGNVDNYAFDIECTYDVETCNHSFAMIVIKKLYTNEEWIFHDIKEFHTFIENINKTKKISHLWGHNARGYDSFILFNIFYNEFNQTPSEIIRNGKKIMMMKYGVVKFLDSMNHIAGSLNNLIPTFGLNIDDKGYFPYRWYTNTNKDYVGPIPNKKYFNCARCKECCSYDKCSSGNAELKARKKMFKVTNGTSLIDEELLSPKQLEECSEIDKDFIYNIRNGSTCACTHFKQWYKGEKKYLYNIKEECQEYCRNDVSILTKALEAYRDLALDITEVDPLKKVTIASFAYEYFRIKHLKPNTIGLLNRQEYDFARLSLQGGRTNALGFYNNVTEEEQIEGRYMRYIDVVSLYPSVQLKSIFPVGHPVIDDDPNLDETIKQIISGGVGFVKCDLIPPKNLYHPLLLVKKNGKLVESLLDEDFVEKVFTMLELKKALELGYIISKVYESHIYEKSSNEIFRSYVDKLFDLKHKYSEENNVGKKSIVKILLNSLWGKFGQKDINKKDDYVDLKKFLNLAKNDKYEIIDFEELSNDKVFVQYNEIESYNLHLNNSNPAIASYTTSHARLVLYEAMSKLGQRVLYHDTDSLIYRFLPEDPVKHLIPEGKAIGAWELEADGELVEFVSIGAKSYAYRTKSGKVKVKSKGFNSDWITFEDYKSIVFQESNFLQVKNLNLPDQFINKTLDSNNLNQFKSLNYLNDFHMKRTENGITNVSLVKKLSWVYDKRVLCNDKRISYPYGFQYLPNQY